jgi:hypothetical protein
MSQLPANPLAQHADDAQKYRRPQNRTSDGYLKFNGKTGEWTFGMEEVEVDGAEMVVNSMSIEHGYLRWGELPPVKVFTPDWEPYPERPESIEGKDQDGKDKTFTAEEARQFQARFVGDDEELGQCIFNTSSMGGVEKVDDLYDKIYIQSKESDGNFYFPRVKLTSEWYKRSTGKVYKPVFEIVGWCDANGKMHSKADKLEAPETDDTPEQEEEQPTRRRRRRTV